MVGCIAHKVAQKALEGSYAITIGSVCSTRRKSASSVLSRARNHLYTNEASHPACDMLRACRAILDCAAVCNKSFFNCRGGRFVVVGYFAGRGKH